MQVWLYIQFKSLFSYVSAFLWTYEDLENVLHVEICMGTHLSAREPREQGSRPPGEVSNRAWGLWSAIVTGIFGSGILSMRKLISVTFKNIPRTWGITPVASNIAQSTFPAETPWHLTRNYCTGATNECTCVCSIVVLKDWEPPTPQVHFSRGGLPLRYIANNGKALSAVAL